MPRSITRSSFLIAIFPLFLFTSTQQALFNIQNNCSYTVWPALLPIGGGQRLDPGDTWTTALDPGATQGRIWARTGCSFNANGVGSCVTGDCGGRLVCTEAGQPPSTMAELALTQVSNLDFFDISLVNGFNVPMEYLPTSAGCTRGPRCSADINSECPLELRVPGGCHGPCTVFQTSDYCCNGEKRCEPTQYSKFFRARCPEAYSYPLDDDRRVLFTCPSGANYTVVFCPS